MKLFAGVRRLLASKSFHRPARSQSRRRMFFEPLESRRLLATDLAAIAGTVFSDQTDDGFSVDDIPVVGANVHLYLDGGNGTYESANGVQGGDDTLIGTDTTDVAGEYRFDGLVEGTYFVEEEVPVGFIIRPGTDVTTVVVSMADAAGTIGVSIDDFGTTDQVATANSGAPSGPNAMAATEALGGERDLLAEYVSGPFDVELQGSSVTGSLIISSDTGTVGNYTIVWDGLDGDATALDEIGLRAGGPTGVDLTAAGVADRLQFLIGADQSGVTLTINIYTDATDFSTFVTTVPVTAGGSATTELLVPFSSFSDTGAGATFSNVGAIELLVDGVAALDAELALVGSIGPTVMETNFANFEPLTLGNLVFNDANNDGVFDSATESGIPNVAVTLYSDTDASGDFTPGTDTLVATTTTDGTGVYQFTGLFPGDYIVQLDESNFNVGNALEGFLSSTGNGPAPDPDDDVNNDDNGDRLTGEGIVSAAITLLPNTEPINDGDTDPDTNHTLDFGVFISADLQITKTDGVTTAVSGQDTLTYTIVVTNAGPSDVVGATVFDAIPANLTNVSYTSTTTGTVTGNTPAGTGDINDTVSMTTGSTITYTVTADVPASATGTVSNTATVTTPPGVNDPTPGNNTATDDDTLVPTADLQITKTDGVTTAIPGQTTLTYTIVVTNPGPSDVTGATVADAFPAGLGNVSYTSTTTGTVSGNTAAGTGDINDTVNMTAGSSITYTVTASVLASATGTISNTATVTPPAGVTDPTPANNTATDEDTLVPTADLQITKTDGVTTAIPGQTTLTYTVVVTNAGPSNVTGATVADTFPAGLSNVSYTSMTTGTVTGNTAAGTGNINDAVNMASGSTITYTVTASVLASATGTISNTATVTAPSGVTDPTPGNNTATDVDTLVPTADLQITKTDGVTTAIPGQTTLTYTIVVTNAGPSNVTGATVADTFPAGLSNVSFTSTTTGTVTGNTAAGTGNINNTVNMASGSTITYTVTASVLASATGTISNTATVTAPSGVSDPTPANNTATDVDTLVPTADLRITKTDGVTTAIPGQTTLTYTIVVTNLGPNNVTGATIADTFPAGLSNVSYTSTTTGTVTGNTATGTGNINDTVSMSPGGTITYTVTASVLASATGTISNTATVTAPAGITDPTPANNTATDTDTLTPRVDLSITKTDSADPVSVGGSFTYTIIARNIGPSNATGVTVADTLPAGVTFGSATTSQGTVNQANGVVTATLGTLTPNQSVTVTVVVTANSAGALAGTVTNTATVSASETDVNSANNSATQTTAIDFLMASIAGSVYNDVNNNGIFEPTESGIANATIRLTGTDLRGAAVDITMQTASDGSYLFANLNPGTYQLQETQPAGFRDGIETAGTGATATVGQDLFQSINLVDAAMAQAFNFGERSQLSKRRFLASS